MRKNSGLKIVGIISFGILAFLTVILFAELSLQFFGYGIDTNPFTKVEIGDKTFYKDNITFINKYYPGASLLVKSEEKNLFSAEKENGVLRGFIIGGAGADGKPYGSNQSFGAFISEAIFRSGKYSKVEMINLGFEGLNSYFVKDIAKKILRFKPDFVIIYSGHDEFYSVMNYKNSDLLLNLKEFKLCQLLINLTSDKSKNTTAAGKMQLSIWTEDQVRNTFVKNITNTAELFEKKGIPVLILEPASNLYDFPPFAGENDKDLTDFIAGYKNAIDIKDMIKIVNYYELSEKTELYRKNASVQYLNGRASCLIGAFRSKAGDHLNNARDMDLIPLRGKSKLFNDLINYYAEKNVEYKNIRLVSFSQPARNMAGIELLGNKLFTDHIHFNIEGGRLISYFTILQLSDMLKLDTAKTTSIFDLNVANFNSIFDISDIDGFAAFMDTYRSINNPYFLKAPIEYSIEPVIDMDNKIVANKDLYNKIKSLSGKDLYMGAIDHYLTVGDMGNGLKTCVSFCRNYPGCSLSHLYLSLGYKEKGDIYSAKNEMKIAYYLSDDDNILKYVEDLFEKDEVAEMKKITRKKKISK